MCIFSLVIVSCTQPGSTFKNTVVLILLRKFIEKNSQLINVAMIYWFNYIGCKNFHDLGGGNRHSCIILQKHTDFIFKVQSQRKGFLVIRRLILLQRFNKQ